MKKSFKKLLLSSTAAAITLSCCLTSFAGTWKQDSTGWWYQNNDGSYPSNGWEWIDGNNDGTAESYYFDKSGYILANTTTPDGYFVNADGAWTENGIVQTKAVSTTPSINAPIDDVELLRYRSSKFIYSEEGFKEVAGLRDHLWNLNISCDKYLKIGDYIYFTGSVSSGFDTNGISLSDHSLYRLLAQGTQYGVPEVLYKLEKQYGSGFDLSSMGQGKLNLSLRNYLITFNMEPIGDATTHYYQYDLLTGTMLESSLEAINATEIKGKYHANDQMYYEVIKNSTFSAKYTVIVRNYKGEQVRTMTIETLDIIPIAENSYLSTGAEFEHGHFGSGAFLDGDVILVRDIRIENCSSAPQRNGLSYTLPEGAVHVMYELKFDRLTGQFLGYEKIS